MGRKKEKTTSKKEDDVEEILCSTTRKSERLIAANAAVAAAALKTAAAAAAPAAVSPTATATASLPPIILEGPFKGYTSPGHAGFTSWNIYREAFEEWREEETERLFTEVIPRLLYYQSTSCVGKRC